MKIKDITIPEKSQARISISKILDAEQDVLQLQASSLENYPEIVGVAGPDDKIIGTVEREMLLFLKEQCSGWVMGQILDRFHEGVVAVDNTGRIFYVNDMYSKILGVSKHVVLGKHLQKIEPGATMLEVLQTRKPILGKAVQIKSVNHHVVVNIYPILRQNELVAVVSIFRDVTETKQLSQALGRVQGLAEYFRQQLTEQEELKKSQIVGKHPAFLRSISQAITVAKTDAPVLLTGENGSGKEVLAKLIHQKSQRCAKPLITVNCAAIPESLLESELFGYAEGSFTGAKRGGKPGKFELADGGTIFLDEIGDMPLVMQAKILRVLQEKEIEKIGRSDNLPVNVRVIAATNRQLEDMVQKGAFRRDLYYRLNVVAIRAPSLRDRGEDIGLFAYHFLTAFNKKYDKSLSYTPEVFHFFSQHDWPGNVRELQNCIEYAVIMCPGPEIGLEHLPPSLHCTDDAPQNETLPVSAQTHTSLRESVRANERELIAKTLEACGHNKTKTMRILGISRRSFYQKLKQYDLEMFKK